MQALKVFKAFRVRTQKSIFYQRRKNLANSNAHIGIYDTEGRGIPQRSYRKDHRDSKASAAARSPSQGPGRSCFSVVTAPAQRQASAGGALNRLPR